MTCATVGSLKSTELARRLRQDGLKVYFGPFVVNLRSNLPELHRLLERIYIGYPLADSEPVCDVYARVDAPRNLRRWIRPKISFYMDDEMPFDPMPRPLALPLMEWGVNWAIATRAHQYFMLHAAVVARDGQALIMPGTPGSGKTTLCAALIHNGWRLLSDEFGLVEPGTGLVTPIPRLLPLKNESIAVIEKFCPEARIGPRYPKTRKGTVAHVVPPTDSFEQRRVPARPRWVLFPRWRDSAPVKITPASRGKTFLALAANSFNYESIGQASFQAATRIAEQCARHTLVYSDLNEAIEAIDRHTSRADA